MILFGPLILKIVSPLDPHSLIARRNPDVWSYLLSGPGGGVAVVAPNVPPSGRQDLQLKYWSRWSTRLTNTLPCRMKIRQMVRYTASRMSLVSEQMLGPHGKLWYQCGLWRCTDLSSSTLWPLGDVAVILKVKCSNSFYRKVAWVLILKLLWGKCHRTSLMRNRSLVQVMARCRLAKSDYLSQCWFIVMSPNDVTRPHLVEIQYCVDKINGLGYLHC